MNGLTKSQVLNIIKQAYNFEPDKVNHAVELAKKNKWLTDHQMMEMLQKSQTISIANEERWKREDLSFTKLQNLRDQKIAKEEQNRKFKRKLWVYVSILCIAIGLLTGFYLILLISLIPAGSYLGHKRNIKRFYDQ